MRRNAVSFFKAARTLLIMCGINGFNLNDRKLLEKMNQATQHRGPDGTGVFIDDHISIGHNLLAIVEKPERSGQPMVSPDRRFVLAYNGEIYNYRGLRSELEALGEKFDTDSDTEVILRGLALDGTSFLKKLDGMFALALYDKEKGRIVLARDRAGMKPLYYYCRNGRLAFSSEIRALLFHTAAVADLDAVCSYFVLGYVPGPSTMFAGISKVCPGQYLDVDLKSGNIETKWLGRISESVTSAEFDPTSFRAMIGSSVDAHTMGLRPFGLYLSGGLDSTVILHELIRHGSGPVKTYTTRFDTNNEELNEDAEAAKRLCGDYNIEHHEFLVQETDFLEALGMTIETLEEPRYNFSVAAYWLLARQASKDVTVLLNGSGGDELFLGYDRYLESKKISSRYERFPSQLVNLWYTLNALRKKEIRPGHFLKLDTAMNRWIFLNKVTPFLPPEIFYFANSFDLVDLAGRLKTMEDPAIGDPLSDRENALAELDRLFWLADEEFLRTDKIAMHFGMEGRFPFMANDLMRFANAVSSDRKMSGGRTKALVKDSYRNSLPDYIINKKKTGWYAPVAEWMSSDLGTTVRETLSDDFYSATAPLFNFDLVRKEYLDTISRFTRSTIKKFWPMFIFQVWAKAFKISV